MLSPSAEMTTEPTVGVSELLIFHPVDTIAKRLMSNKAKVSSQLTHSGGRANFIKGLVLHELDHFPRCSLGASVQEDAVAIPWSRLCRGLQDLPANLQVWRSTMVQRLDQETLQR